MLLIHTLGNRDLQFSRKSHLPAWFVTDYLEPNAENPDFFVLKKEDGSTFRERSRYLKNFLQSHEDQKSLLEAICFPMLEAAIQFVHEQQGVERIQRILLSGTLQFPPYKYDTDLIAELAKLYLEQQFPHQDWFEEVVIDYLSAAPIGDGKVKILNHYHELLKQQTAEGFQQIYISNQQGLPDASAALRFVGFFQPYHYLSMHAREGVSLVRFEEHEKILSELIQHRLQQLFQQSHLYDLLSPTASE